MNIWTDVEYSPCPPPPPPPPGQPYPPLPPPPLANPWCGPADVRPSVCFPGEAFYSRVVPPGYYGPPSWYPTIGVRSGCLPDQPPAARFTGDDHQLEILDTW